MNELEALIAIYEGLQVVTALFAFSIGLTFALFIHIKGYF